MNRKQWTCLALTLLLGALSLIVGAVVLIDPFEIYHQATVFTPPIANGTQIYSNAGIAKSYEYDSVVIGSSMTENFRPSQLDSLLGGRFVKLCVNAGTPYNHRQMMDMAFGTHDVRRVLYGLDVEALTYFYTQPKCEMPDYLYDGNLFNDVQYWFNQSVLARYIPACLRTLGTHDENQRDTMYTWGDPDVYTYGAQAALAGITFSSTPVEQGDARTQTPVLSQASRLNVEHNILPIIEAHPETEFIIFFPPYSLARWYEFYSWGTLHYHLNQKEALIDILLGYDNVQIYDFQACADIITNLDLYIDAGHYGPQINGEMAEAISRGEHRVTGLAQAQENDGLLCALVDQIVQAGSWPDTFVY